MTEAEWWIQRRIPGNDKVWAVREDPFDWDAERDGACCAVHGKDLLDLCRNIAKQESIADLVGP